jgi:hypothetical protein
MGQGAEQGGAIPALALRRNEKREMNKPTIFLAGIEGHCVASLVRIANERNALVLDLRNNPYEPGGEWSKRELESVLMIRRYSWYGRYWGKRSAWTAAGEPQIQVHDFQGGYDDLYLLLKQRSLSLTNPIHYDAIILLDDRREIEGTQKGYVGRRLKERLGWTVRTLAWKQPARPKAERKNLVLS